MAKTSKAKGNDPLGIRMMPRDVATRWNYTYEMLNFAYIYREAYDEITANKDMKMRLYELLNKEWKIVKDLSDILKVLPISSLYQILICFQDFQGCYFILFEIDSQSCQSNPRYGRY